METNVKFEEEKEKVIKVIHKMALLNPLQLRSKHPELWEAMLDAETQIDEVPENAY